MVLRYHPFISDWINIVESGKFNTCKEQKELIVFVKKILSDSNIIFLPHFVEDYVKLTEKYFFKLMPDQKFYASLILSLFYKPKNDNVSESDLQLVFPDVFLMAGRGWGKNGFISSLANFFITPYHGIKKYHVDIVANSEGQAKTSFNEVYDVIEELGPAEKRLYYYNKTLIEYKQTKSEIKYYTSNPETKDGGRPGCVIFDEVHQYEDYENINVFTGGLGKKARPRTIMITTDGYVRDAVIDDYKEKARRILIGEDNHNGFLPIIMKMDSEDEVSHPELWDKANPRIHYSDTLKSVIEKQYQDMLKNEDLKVGFLTKRMNLPVENKDDSICSWDDLVKACKRPWIDLDNCECIGGIDYADLNDFAAVGLRFKQDGQTYFFQHTFIHENSLRLTDYGINIDECIEAGTVTVVKESESPVIPPSLIADWFEAMNETYFIKEIHCDMYRYNLIKEEFENRGLPPTVMVRSGAITHNLLALPLMQMFIEGSITLEDDKLMRWYIWNTGVKVDKKGNKTFYKIEAKRRKTDGFFCLLHTLAEDNLEDGTKAGDLLMPVDF